MAALGSIRVGVHLGVGSNLIVHLDFWIEVPKLVLRVLQSSELDEI